MQPEPPTGGTGPAARFRPLIDLEDGTVVAVETRCGPSPAELTAAAGSWVDHVRATRGPAPDLFLTPAAEAWARADTPRLLRHAMVATGLDPAHLVVTVLPSLEAPERAANLVAPLVALGVRVALGGLGGRLSLVQLAGVGPSVVRVEPTLVARAATDERSATVLERLVGLAHDLELDTVADGLHDRAALAAAQRSGVRFGSGDVIGEPVRPWSLDLDPHRIAAIDLTDPAPATRSWSPRADR